MLTNNSALMAQRTTFCLVAFLIFTILSTTCTITVDALPVNDPTKVSISAAPGNKGTVYHWELDNIPKSVSQLTKPLHLLDPLTPGKSGFDIAQDPIRGTKEKRTLFATLLEKRAPSTTTTTAVTSDRILRSLYPANSYARSKNPHSSFVSQPLPNKAFGGAQSRYIRLEYQMLFQPGFDWVKGGKLPGILSGSEGDAGCKTGCSGGGTAENCFSTRMMWRADGEGELYLYAAKSVYFPRDGSSSGGGSCKRSLDRTSPESLFGIRHQSWLEADHIPGDDEGEVENDESEGDAAETMEKRALSGFCLQGMKITVSPGAKNICNPEYGISIGRGGGFKFQSGQWHNVTQIVRVNSKGDAVKDGYLVVYLDGKVVIRAEDIVLLKKGYNSSTAETEEGQVKFMFSSFFGGGSSDYATPKDQWIGWKDFKMTSSPINFWE
ncbi:hypothetical protein BG004_005842 [Podila humilis]|nr:hypothetical protein BG004_005842 [Podila humilis]